MTEETYKPPAVKGGIALAILLSLLTSHSNGQQQPVMDATPSAAVQLVGNPKNYQDGAIYNVTIQLQEEYDSVLITGVFSAASTFNGYPNQVNPYQHKMCAILHSYARQRPINRVDFLWKAPPEEMGCVDFIATLSRRDLVSSKGERIFSICPVTASVIPGSESSLSEVEEDGIVMRDDFEGSTLVPSLWKDTYFSIAKDCEPIFQGKFARFCNDQGSGVGYLTTTPLNLTTAEALQFVLGQPTCPGNADSQHYDYNDVTVTLYYGQPNAFFDNECSSWEPFKIWDLPKGKAFAERVVALPKSAQKDGVCLRWSFQTASYQCVGLDNVVVTSSTSRASALHADLDSFRPSDWYSYPGGVLSNGCHNSRGRALLFGTTELGIQWATTRELDVASSSSAVEADEILWKLDLDAAVASSGRWEFANGTIENSCSTSSRHIVVHQAYERNGLSVCSPSIDLSSAGTIRFRLESWNSHQCQNESKNSPPNHVAGVINIWFDRADINRKIMIVNDQDLTKKVTTFSLPIPSEAQAKDTRVCWQLIASAHEKTASPYVLDDFYFLTSLPSPIDYVLQFRLNFVCAVLHHQSKSSSSDLDDDSEYHVTVQYSTDHGHQWNNLHNLCLPPACTGVQSSIQSTWSSLDTTNPWERITLPIPYAGIANPLRLRFLQKGRALKVGSATKIWAIDDIHVSNCLSGCHGHGTCVDTDRCSCDVGYEGPWCQFPTTQLPTVLREDFEGDEALGSTFHKFTGVELGARCGRVTSGLAAIFNRAGPRQLITPDMNTVESSVLRFGLKMNGPRRYHQHHCPGPDRPLESIYVHSSCNGGVTWFLLRVIQPTKNDAKLAELIQIELPPEARGISCRFKVWQPHHSGAGRDVWVIDDFYLGPPLTDRLARHFAIEDKPSKDAFVGRHPLDKHCNRTNVMVLQPNEMEETFPVRIESFSILQIEVALGCGQAAGQTLPNNSVVVQYSTDGGNHWSELLGSRRHASELQQWKRIGLNLPPEVWSDETRFRVAQTGRLADRSVLAVHYFYAGPNNCPELCRGNGRCTLMGCICDEGFEQPNCTPSSPLRLLTPTSNSFTTNGGRFIDIDRDGCLVRGTNNLIFDSPGVRYLETKEVEYSAGGSIYFFLRLGECDSRTTSPDVHVNVELSWNGGSEWSHLAEYRSPFFPHPKLLKIDVPSPVGQDTNYPPFKIRFVQAGIHGKDRNVWSIAGLTSSSAANLLTTSDISNLDEPLEENKDLWLVANDPDPKTSCLAFDTHCLVKVFFYGMVSRELKLSFGDFVQFDVVVPQLGASNGGAEEVRLEYSSNGGLNWQLLRPECRHTWANCPSTFQSSRIDYRSLESFWNKQQPDRYYFSVSDEIAEKPILLRWLHQIKGNNNQPIRGFKLKNLLIGAPCSNQCYGQGKCSKAICNCYLGYDGDNCSNSTEKNQNSPFYDTFPLDESAEGRPTGRWHRVVGGKVVPNYCHHSTNAVMFFGSEGPRMLQTVELDSQNLRMVQFTLGVTTVPVYKKSCRSTMEHLHTLPANVTTDFSFLVLDYSNDNGLTWDTLESWPLVHGDEKRLGVVLPHPARTPATMLRWWQLTRPGFEAQSLFWYLDDVLVNINETNPITFEYELDPNDDPVFPPADSPDWIGDGITNWLGWQGLVSREEHHPVDTQLERSGKDHEVSLPAYAETWDMEISDPTFAQFQLMVPPEGQAGDRAVVRFEYSTDMGKRWRLVEEECFFIGGYCERLHPPSRYAVGKENNATRITVHLPRRAITRSTRFRWITDINPERLVVPWGIGHVYVGGTCPWMCSGHGTCHHGFCQCDPGFGNSDCVPIDPLPRHIASHFDEDVENRKYMLTGGGISGGCGILSSGMSAVFHEGGLRHFESTDLDVTSGSYAQITVKFNCWAETESFMSSSEPFNHRLLLQYSVNGGITWTLIQEVMPHEDRNPQLVVVNLMRIPDLTNSTRFRLWQPSHLGEGWDTWAVDSFVVHSLTDPGTILYSTFHDPGASPDQWLTWPGGQVQSFCGLDNALAFLGQIGEQEIFTTDLTVTPETVLQFELNVGCASSQSILDAPVRLEYSLDGGAEWKLVVGDENIKKNPYERMPVQTPTIYYSSTSGKWRRETISVAHLETTKPARFRWTQGFVNGTDKSAIPHWGIRNIVISPRCPEMCNGHGKCVPDGGCLCDDGYLGDSCELIGVGNPQEFHETFNSKVSDQPEWARTVGGETISSTSVGLGSAFAVNQPGIRMLETRDLDLTHANFVQFYLDSNELSVSTDSVLLLQYSQNGGIQWTTFYVIHLNRVPFQEVYQIPIPPRATTSATRLRWWQVGEHPDGLTGGWLIDEIFIGGEFYAKSQIEDDFSSNDVIKENWLFVSGGKIEPSCHSPTSTLHFVSVDSPMLAVTKDIRVQGNMYLQYEITTGCYLPSSCNRIRLEYSTNYGLTWKSIPEDCVPGDDIDCQAYSLHTELLSGATGRKSLITFPLPLTHGVVRLRWTGNDKPDYDWSLNYVFVGSTCGQCNGRGRCWRGSCVCDPDWKGANCESHNGNLLSSVRETFDTIWSKEVWAKVNGGSVSSICGTLDSGASLHFHEACDRFAETQDLDLRHIEVIQFHLRSNCGRGSSTDRPGRVLFQYSTNGGVKWHTGLTLALDKFSESRLVSYLVPEEARADAVKLRFWQLVAPDMEDWAIDSFIFDSTLNTTRAPKPETLAMIDARTQTEDNSQITLISETIQKPTVTLEEEGEDDLQQTRDLISDLGLQLSSLNEVEDYDDDDAQQSRNPFNPADLKNLGIFLSNERGAGEDDTSLYQRDETPVMLRSKNLPELLPQKLWWRKTNSDYVGEHCGQRGRIMRGKSSATEESVLETSDFFADSLAGRLLLFDVIVGSCNNRQEQVDQSYEMKFPLRLEASFDHGVTWSLFHSLKLRGETGNDPQSPSVFVQLGKWKTYRYSLDHLSGFQYARFRWRQFRSSFSKFWAINNLNVNIIEDNQTPELGLVPLMEDFSPGQVSSQWNFTSGGKVILPGERLGDGQALSFYGTGFKWLETAHLDLTFGETVQFILQLQAVNRNRLANDTRVNTVFLQCSPDYGLNWFLMDEFQPRFYELPVLTHSLIPSKCQNIQSTLRWWQSIEPDHSDAMKKSAAWLIDNILVDNSDVFLTEIRDHFRDGKISKDNWEFYPDGAITSKLCGSSDGESALNFSPVESSRFSGITSRHIVVKDNYAVYFKIKTSCGKISCRHINSTNGVRFELRRGYGIPAWTLVKLSCLPSKSSHLCDPQQPHGPSVYTFNSYESWQRVIIPLHSFPTSNWWQFRWVAHRTAKAERNNWSLRDVYVGKMCPSHCNSNGDCIRGRCHCDPGFEGPTCLPVKKFEAHTLPLMDHFEELKTSFLWESIHGAGLRVGCGSLLPQAHGKHLHFDGCGVRMATTIPLDAKFIRRIAFVIRIGTPQQIPTCRIQPAGNNNLDPLDKSIVFQYSFDGVDWRLIALHGIKSYTQPQRVMYTIPAFRNATTVRFRWWQPVHGGSSWDQWAIDNVEILA